MYKEEVNDFRVIALSFGRSDYIWNQLVDVYNDWGKLNGGVVRVKRTGAGMYDTSYQIAPTARDSEMPEDRQADIEELPPIREYYLGRYGGGNMPSSNNVVSTTEETAKSLF